MTASKTPSHLAQGHSAEQQACDYLLGRGLALVERNYRTSHGEIDLIMRDAGTLVFVEVRFRRSRDFGGPAESVDRAKQGKLRASAAYYLQRHRGAAKQPCRFDVVALSGAPGQAQLEWLPNAFGG
jgi:putative endonuclease